mgnify:CR=1 FL=1
MAVIDVITYNGEKELFEIRYHILKDVVDEFRVIEFDKTFSGRAKEKTFNQNWDKVKHYFIKEDVWGKYWEEAKKSPNTNYGEGAKHWLREWAMKESIKDCLTDLEDDDIIYVGDADEVWGEFPVSNDVIFKLKLRVYAYWLNNRSSEDFWGTIVGRYKNIKQECLNELRSHKHTKTQIEWGWHFTSLAPYLKQKLQDSYTEETYATEQILSNLSRNIQENKDFLGRDFIYRIDERQWPQYLQEHKKEYSQLCLKTVKQSEKSG